MQSMDANSIQRSLDSWIRTISSESAALLRNVFDSIGSVRTIHNINKAAIELGMYQWEAFGMDFIILIWALLDSFVRLSRVSSNFNPEARLNSQPYPIHLIKTSFFQNLYTNCTSIKLGISWICNIFRSLLIFVVVLTEKPDNWKVILQRLHLSTGMDFYRVFYQTLIEERIKTIILVSWTDAIEKSVNSIAEILGTDSTASASLY